MKLPKKIIIMGYEYMITEINDMTKISDDRKEAYAYINFEKQHINVYSKLSNYKKWVALIHEVLHGCYNVAGLSEKYKDEEQDIVLLSHVILDTFVRNGFMTIIK